MSASAPRHSLNSYLSQAVRARLRTKPQLETPECSTSHGAVLLTDIQGFTALVEGFTSSGKAGLEEITWRLNAYVSEVVDAVESNGGDVLSIAGDAFLCHWSATRPADIPTAVLRAAEAGLLIQRKMNGQGSGFPTRIGIGSGELIVAHVGGVGGRWELVASGAALAEAAAAERMATPGHVLISQQAWEHVADACEGHATTAGVELRHIRQPLAREIREPIIVPDERLLHPFVPPAVLARLVAHDADWLAESRTVTVALCAVPGLSTTAPADVARVHECVRAAQELANRYEGTTRVDVDDKGLLLLTIFGLPPRAHEDDAVRALLFANALQRAVASLQPGVGVGVATGRVLCGAFGNDVRRDYIVRGDVINLAARLMHAEQNAVLCDTATMQATRGRIAFHSLPAIRVRGRAEPVPVFRPTGRSKSAKQDDAGIIGRAREQDVIGAQLATLGAGAHAGVSVIEGEAGLGKSKLAEITARRARDANIRVLIGASDAIEQSTPYYAWRPVFSALFELATESDPAAVQSRVIQRLDGLPDAERLLPLLSGVLAVPIPDNALTAEMTGDVRADNTRRFLVQILQHFAAERPTLLIVEDAHWLDSASWGVLVAAAQSVRPLMLLVAARPLGEPAPADFATLIRMAAGRHLRLGALSAEETHALVRQRLGVADVPAELTSFVEQRVSGNPFFAEELLRALRDAGIVRVRDDICTVGNLEAVDLPTTVEGVIISRLDRLTAGEQLCLKVAAVIGRVFRERVVRDTHPVDAERPAVHSHLEALTTVDLTILEAPEPDLAYMFKHVITRDVTYESMPLAQRQPMHRAVATWYEHTYADDLAPYYALLAYHFARAVAPAKTIDYLEKAGEQALFAGAFHEAVVLLTQAVELAEGGDVSVPATRRALWEKGLGRARYYLGALHASRLHNERAVAVLHRPVPASAGATAAAALAAIGLQVRHRLFPRRYFGRRGTEKALLDEAVECYKILGQAYYLEGEPALKLLYLTVTGLNVGEEAGSSAALARVAINNSTLTYLLGLPRQGEWYGRYAISIAEKEGLAAAAYVWHIHALALAQRGNWAASRAANERARAQIEELGDFGLEAEAWTVRTTVAVCEGDFVSAQVGWKRQRELAERNDNAQLRCWSLLDEADTCLGVGDTDGATRALDAALAIPTAATDIGTALDKARTTAMTRLREGRIEDALHAVDAVLEPFSGQPPLGYQWADDLCEATEVALAILERDGEYTNAHRQELEQRVTAGCRLAKKHSRIFRHIAARSLVLRGRLLAYRGTLNEARKMVSKAVNLAAGLDMPFEAARARLALARLASGDDRIKLVRDAAPVFERLGATYYLNELTALGGYANR